jgi:hypothetical protein
MDGRLGSLYLALTPLTALTLAFAEFFFPCTEYGDIVVFSAWFEGYTHCAWTCSWGHVLGMVQVRHISKLDESSKMLTLAVISSFVAFFLMGFYSSVNPKNCQMSPAVLSTSAQISSPS